MFVSAAGRVERVQGASQQGAVCRPRLLSSPVSLLSLLQGTGSGSIKSMCSIS